MKYAVPWAKHTLGVVDLLRPSIEAVELRHHGSEKAVTLEGRNLWFCYQISVGSHPVKTPHQDLSGTSIQFNVPNVPIVNIVVFYTNPYRYSNCYSLSW